MSIYQVANNVRIDKQCHCLSFQLPRNAILHTFVAVVVVVVVLAFVKFLHFNNSSKLWTSSCFFPSTLPRVPPPSQVPLIFFPNPLLLLLLFLEIRYSKVIKWETLPLTLLSSVLLCPYISSRPLCLFTLLCIWWSKPLINYRVVHNNGANISHQTVSALKHFQCQQRTTGQNNSANHCFYMQSWSDINHELNAKLVRLILQTSHFNSQSGQNNSANQWSKLVRLNLQTSNSISQSGQNKSANQWTCLQTSDLQVHSSSSISPYHILVFILDINQAMHYSFFTSHPTLCCSNLEIVFLLQKLWV